MNQKIQKLISTVKNFKTLESNWDSYNAEPIPEKVIDKALYIIQELWKYNVCFDCVFPGCNENIQFDGDGKYNDIEFEIYKDKSILTIYDHEGNILIEIQIKIDEDLSYVRDILKYVIHDIKLINVERIKK